MITLDLVDSKISKKEYKIVQADVQQISRLVLNDSLFFQVIFTQFQYSDQSSLQPSSLRQALAKTFAKQEKFQLGHMDDAAECFVSMIRAASWENQQCGFRTGLTQASLYSHRSRLEA